MRPHVAQPAQLEQQHGSEQQRLQRRGDGKRNRDRQHAERRDQQRQQQRPAGDLRGVGQQRRAGIAQRDQAARDHLGGDIQRQRDSIGHQHLVGQRAGGGIELTALEQDVDDRAAQEDQAQQRRQRQRHHRAKRAQQRAAHRPPFGGGGVRGQPWKRRLADRLAQQRDRQADQQPGVLDRRQARDLGRLRGERGIEDEAGVVHADRKAVRDQQPRHLAQPPVGQVEHQPQARGALALVGPPPQQAGQQDQHLKDRAANHAQGRAIDAQIGEQLRGQDAGDQRDIVAGHRERGQHKLVAAIQHRRRHAADRQDQRLEQHHPRQRDRQLAGWGVEAGREQIRHEQPA